MRIEALPKPEEGRGLFSSFQEPVVEALPKPEVKRGEGCVPVASNMRIEALSKPEEGRGLFSSCQPRNMRI
jgi:hypothetical protein